MRKLQYLNLTYMQICYVISSAAQFPLNKFLSINSEQDQDTNVLTI